MCNMLVGTGTPIISSAILYCLERAHGISTVSPLHLFSVLFSFLTAIRVTLLFEVVVGWRFNFFN